MVLVMENELRIPQKCTISVPENADIVIQTATNGFIKFMQAKMQISLTTGCDGLFCLRVDETDKEEISFRIAVSDKVIISASNSKAAAQALYYLEDLMTYRGAPILKKETQSKTLGFTSRMISLSQSIADATDEYLSQVAHSGFTAVKIVLPASVEDDICSSFIDKCEKHGLDVYYVSHIESKYHPDEPGAKEYYESTYGALCIKFPKVKGVILIGESLDFPSKDPETCGTNKTSPDNIPPLKLRPMGYPCNDYYKLVNIIKEVTRPKNPSFEIIFWSYNWSSDWFSSWSNITDEKRLALIDTLPTDVSYMCTFEVGATYELDGITKHCSDYTLAIPGPARVFCVEAQRAKERGLKLYSMTSTGGITQDLNAVPYLPCPQKFIKRFEAMRKAKEDYNLTGTFEGWLGFHPTIISELAKMCFLNPDSDYYENLRFLTRHHYGQHADRVYEAFDLWSTATDYIHATYETQYGPCRVGTAFPLCFLSEMTPPPPYKNPWCDVIPIAGSSGYQTNYTVRFATEQKHWQKMAALMKQGADLLAEIENPPENIVRLETLGRYIYHCIQTVINVRRWHQERFHFFANPTTNEEVAASLDRLEAIAREEIENCQQSIVLLRKEEKYGPLAIGAHPYASAGAVEWKIRQVEYVINWEIAKSRIELRF